MALLSDKTYFADFLAFEDLSDLQELLDENPGNADFNHDYGLFIRLAGGHRQLVMTLPTMWDAEIEAVEANEMLFETSEKEIN